MLNIIRVEFQHSMYQPERVKESEIGKYVFKTYYKET